MVAEISVLENDQLLLSVALFSLKSNDTKFAVGTRQGCFRYPFDTSV